MRILKGLDCPPSSLGKSKPCRFRTCVTVFTFMAMEGPPEVPKKQKLGLPMAQEVLHGHVATIIDFGREQKARGAVVLKRFGIKGAARAFTSCLRRTVFCMTAKH